MIYDDAHIRFLLTGIYITLQKIIVLMPEPKRSSKKLVKIMENLVDQEKEVLKKYSEYQKKEKEMVKNPFGEMFKNAK